MRFSEQGGDCSVVYFEGAKFASPDGLFFSSDVFQPFDHDIRANDFDEVCFAEDDKGTVIEPEEGFVLFEQVGRVCD